MTSGAKAALALWAAAILWDLKCPAGQTISEAVSRGLADEHTRLPIASVIAMSVAHVFALAAVRGLDLRSSRGYYEAAFRNMGGWT